MLCAGDFALLDRDVNDLMRPGAIARRVNVRRARLHPRVRDDAPVFVLNAGVFQTERRRVRHPARARKKFPRPATRTFCRRARTKLPSFSAARASRSFVPVKSVMPSRRKTFSSSMAASASNSFKICSLRWIERHLDAEAREELRELHGHRAAAENDERLGQFLERERVVAGEIADFVELGQGRRRDAGAGGDDEMFRAVNFWPVLNSTVCASVKRALARMNLNLPPVSCCAR